MCFADESGQYLPDFVVTCPDGSRLYIEVKPTKELARQWINERMSPIWSSDPNGHLIATWFNESEYEPRWLTLTRHRRYTTRELAYQWSENRPWCYGSRIEMNGLEVTIDIIDDAEFESLNAKYSGKPGQPWEGPALDEAEGWRLVMPTTTDRPWWPASIEVSNDNIVTDTYGGQWFVRGEDAQSYAEVLDYMR